MKKSKLLILGILVILGYLYAEDPIVLPEISTNIGESETVLDPEAIPDFTLVLPQITGELPELIDSGIKAEDFIPPEQTNISSDQTQQVFIEGKIGSGYPVFFSGDFNIYQNTGKEPFEFNFTHNTINAYGSNLASNGYSSIKTQIDGKKLISLSDIVILNISGLYQNKTDGLQGNSELFHNITHQNAVVYGGVNWDINKNSFFVAGLNTNVFAQYAGLTGSENVPFSDDINAGSSIGFTLSPEAEYKYTNGKLDFSGKLSYIIGNTINRPMIGTNIGYFFMPALYGSASFDVVFPLHTENIVLFPFNILFKIGAAADPSMNGTLTFGGLLSGGLRTNPTDLIALQIDYPYMFTGSKQYEETEWFASFTGYMPFLRMFRANISVDFASSAFGGKHLICTSIKNTSNGLLLCESKSVQILDTQLELTAHYNIFELSVGWNASWFDLIDKTYNHAIETTISIIPEKQAWECSLSASFPIQEVFLPEISLLASYAPIKSLKIELEVNDFITLFTGTPRNAKGSYLTRGGYAAIYTKIYF